MSDTELHTHIGYACIPGTLGKVPSPLGTYGRLAASCFMKITELLRAGLCVRGGCMGGGDGFYFILGCG